MKAKTSNGAAQLNQFQLNSFIFFNQERKTRYELGMRAMLE